MLSFMGRDFLKAPTGECWETGLGEGRLVVLGKCTRVERVLEVLEGQRVLQEGKM